MNNKHRPASSAAHPFIVSLIALVAIHALTVIPILGLKRDVALAQIGGFHSRFSVAAVALSSWLPAVLLVQSALLFLPARWIRDQAGASRCYGVPGAVLGRDGLANPFGLAALGLTLVFLFGQAEGVVIALQTTNAIEVGERAADWAMASLFVGTALFIVVAWIIDCFGVRHGFWVVLAMMTTADLLAAAVQIFEQARTSGTIGVFVPLTITAAFMAVTVFLTMIILKQGGRFEFVAWPLLLLTLLGIQTHNEQVSRIFSLFIPLALATIGLAVFVLLRRAGLLRLFLPVAGTLAAMASFELQLNGAGSSWVLPLHTSMLVASSAILTTLWHDWRSRDG